MPKSIADLDLEAAACDAARVELADFNQAAVIPYGLTVSHICDAMNEFIGFLTMVNRKLVEGGSPRFETILMPANFSSIVGEFMSANIPKKCSTLAKNLYHNGHPDLVPAGRYPRNTCQYGTDGIEIKASRYLKAWQGHNPEDVWLMVFVFDCNRGTDVDKGLPPRPFRFLQVLGAQLQKIDWVFAGRSETSRRTITASVTESGYRKMKANWIYAAQR